jgi:hypothetical protein
VSELLTFDPSAHVYRVEGKVVPGVTSILAFGGLVTLGGTDEQLENARERGTAVHTATELDDRGTLDEVSLHPSLWGRLYAWRAFREEWEFVPTHIETRVFHKTYGYAGTFDRLGTSPKFKGPVLLDIKSGTEQAATGPQLAAYLHAFTDLPSERKRITRMGVYLRDDCSYKAVVYNDPNDIFVFTAALTLWNWRQRHA